jgi:hypothetical protein
MAEAEERANNAFAGAIEGAEHRGTTIAAMVGSKENEKLALNLTAIGKLNSNKSPIGSTVHCCAVRYSGIY